MLSLEDSRIDFVLCRHEQAAAFMADAYGRLTGKAGVCLSTLGPGATNLVTGLADANMDRAPAVAIIGQGSTRRLHKESHQNMDAIGMMEPISKWAQTVWSAETETPGVTVIELPEHVAKEDLDKHVMAPSVTRRPAADHKAVRSAIDAIEQATNPIILAGNGALRKRTAKQLRHFAHKTGIPVVNTFMGKGAIAMSDPHCLFTMGLQGRDHVNKAFEKSDTVITVGYDLVEIAPIFWNPDCDKTIIHIDFMPADIDMDYPLMVDVVSDLADALWQINESLNERLGAKLPLYDINDWAELRQTIADDLSAEKYDTSFPMKPQRILNDVRSFLDLDFEMLAKFFDMRGKVIDGPGQITAAMEEAFAQDSHALIAVPVDYSENQKLTKRLDEIDVAI